MTTKKGIKGTLIIDFTKGIVGRFIREETVDEEKNHIRIYFRPLTDTIVKGLLWGITQHEEEFHITIPESNRVIITNTDFGLMHGVSQYAYVILANKEGKSPWLEKATGKTEDDVRRYVELHKEKERLELRLGNLEAENKNLKSSQEKQFAKSQELSKSERRPTDRSSYPRPGYGSEPRY